MRNIISAQFYEAVIYCYLCHTVGLLDFLAFLFNLVEDDALIGTINHRNIFLIFCWEIQLKLVVDLEYDFCFLS